MTDLLTDGTLHYNGVDFSVFQETLAFQAKPVPDKSGRTVAYVTYTITVTDIVTVADPNDSTDDTLALLRKKLMAYGGNFAYSNKGLGNIEIQMNRSDVRYGPKPLSLSFKPYHNKAVRVTWTVQVDMVECGQDPSLLQKGLLEFTYNLNFHVDDSGYTKRTYTGMVKVAGVRTSIANRSLFDHADRLRDDINPAIPDRFRRVSQDYQLNEDKTEMRFSIVDEQMPPNIPPAGVVMVSASHTVQTPKILGALWTGTVNAEYEMANYRNRAKAYDHFFALVKERVKQTVQFARSDPDRGGTTPTGIRTGLVAIVPVGFRASEPEIYGRRSASFSFTYTFSTTLLNLVKASALWLPVSDTYAQWAQAMTPITGPRGTAGLALQMNDDTILDFCAQKKPQPVQSSLRALWKVPQETTPQTGPIFEDPTPEKSWIIYENEMRVEPREDTIELKPLPRQIIKPELKTRSMDEGGGGYRSPYRGQKPSIIQHRAKPTLEVVLEGRAVRAKYSIPCPELTTVAGKPVVPCNRDGDGYRTRVITNVGVPLIAAYWHLRYLLPEIPDSDIVCPASPLEGEPVTGTFGLKTVGNLFTGS